MKTSIIEFKAYEDSHDVPVIHVNDLGGLYAIDPMTIQMTMVNQITRGESAITKAVVHQIWDVEAWRQFERLLHFAAGECGTQWVRNAMRTMIN